MYKLGIDVGGTKIKAILLDNKNKSVLVFNIATPKNKKAFLENLEREISKIIKNKNISGIGIGLPGTIDIKRGVLIKAKNLPYLKNWQVKKSFLKFNKNIKIENDSRCFLIAEAFLGAGRKYKNIVALTIGTGIGGGIMINGKIYYGKNYVAGEFGYTIIQDEKTLEQLGAKNAFLKYGDRSEIIGIGVANLINSFDPEVVILGGGRITNKGINLDVVKKTAKKYILFKNTPIVKTKLGENSQAIGAALL